MYLYYTSIFKYFAMEKEIAIYDFLMKEGAPKMLVEALKLFGTTEIAGQIHNPEILSWAQELGIPYTQDETPWCGLFMAIVAKRAGKKVPEEPLWALNWGKFGVYQNKAMLGDVLTFKRPGGGGHVGLYVYENKNNYGVLGGNQKDKVGIVEVKKIRLVDIRRPKYNIQPANVRQIILHGNANAVSNNEK